MKKIPALILALLIAITSSAQTASAVQRIREMYASALNLVKMQDVYREDGIPENNTQIVMKRNLPGTGEQKSVMNFYYSEDDSEESFESNRFFFPVFVTVKYNYAAVNFYDEYLFDEEGKPAFLFRRSDSYSEEGKVDEQRFYIAGGKVVKKLINVTPQANVIEDPMEEFSNITAIFNSLIAPIH